MRTRFLNMGFKVPMAGNIKITVFSKAKAIFRMFRTVQLFFYKVSGPSLLADS